MKNVRMFRDYDYRPTRHMMRAYKGGQDYKVVEAAALAIVAAGVGEIIGEEDGAQSVGAAISGLDGEHPEVGGERTRRRRK